MKTNTPSNIIIEGARIGFRNFSGKEGRYNPEGRRNFCLFLDDTDLANQLKLDGWNIRYLQPRDPNDLPQAYLQVSVSFGRIPPAIYLVTSKGKTRLDESMIDMLDWAEIANIDLIVRPYNYEVGTRTGIKAYLKTMYVTIQEDAFANKYRDVPDSAINSLVKGRNS